MRSLRLPLLCTLALLLALGLVACGDSADPGSDASNNQTDAGQPDANTNDNGNGNGNTNTNQNTAPLAAVHRVGRFDEGDPTGPRFTWPGASFVTRLSGTELQVELDGAAGVFFEVVVDGVSTSVLETTGGSATYTVASGLGAGEHDVEIYRRNEGFFGAVQFVQFLPGGGGALVETPRPWAHRLEFIGDSITCGYGVEGPDELCSFSGATESAYLSYAAVAARALSAEAHLIAYSGKGVYQNYGGDLSEPMPAIWDRTLTDDPSSTWDFSAWTPEAVVINLGTNDFSAALAEADFVTAYVDLLTDVRLRYPAAHIFCVSWPSWGAPESGWVQLAMAASGDPDLTEVSFSRDPADGWGCDYHPSATTQQKLGQQLADEIAATLGW